MIRNMIYAVSGTRGEAAVYMYIPTYVEINKCVWRERAHERGLFVWSLDVRWAAADCMPTNGPCLIQYTIGRSPRKFGALVCEAFFFAPLVE